MHFKPLSSPPKRYSGTLIKTILMMKFTVFLLLVACMQVSASGFSQVSLAEKNVPLRSVFKKIQKQTGFDFLYGSQLLQEAGNVSIDVSNVSLENALDLCFKGKPLAYTIIEKTIVVKPKPLVSTSASRSHKRLKTATPSHASWGPFAPRCCKTWTRASRLSSMPW